MLKQEGWFASAVLSPSFQLMLYDPKAREYFPLILGNAATALMGLLEYALPQMVVQI